MLTILVIEDQDDIRELICMVLGLKYQVLESADGLAGLALYEKHHPDIVLTDLNLPGLCGQHLVERIRSSGSKAKIIAMTAFSRFQLPEDNLDVELYLTKPIDFELLDSHIERLVDPAQSARQASAVSPR
jgi:CheY-like chemotaxis protein